MRLIFGIYLLFISFALNAQVIKPVKWKSELKDLGNNEFEIIAKGTIDKGWHLYSTTHPADGIGIPAEFVIAKNSSVEVLGKIVEVGDLKEAYSELFEQEEKFFENKVEYRQKVKLKVDKPTTLKAEVSWQVCDDEKCLAPDFKEFSYDLKPAKKEEIVENQKEEKQTKEEEKPEEDSAVVNQKNTNLDSIQTIQEGNKIAKLEPKKSIQKDEIKKEEKSLWRIFVLGFLGGLAALLMPCLYPMIPLTVSIFTKQSQSKGSGISKALLYGVSIIVIYVVLGLLVTAIFGPSALNVFSTDPWVNIGFFALFFIFALSFFGAFEITLPSNWVNFADKGADKGGLIGIFFMAFTLALVSFSCTGPIIGTLLVDAANSGETLAPALGMFGFSLALALPFTLFAIFPSWLSSLPKSGGWMNVLKVALGFIELAFALKFLSNADLVWQAGWLPRELFLAIWIAIFLALALYLFNVFKASHDSDVNGVSTVRILFGILSLTVVFYLLPGMWGAPLKLLSGLTPPKNYAESPHGFLNNGLIYNNDLDSGLPENAEFGPNGIPVFLDIDEAFAYAKKVNKPVMIDFTGDACANCRKMEETVWVDERVLSVLKNDVVIASLFADRRVKLPEEQRVYSEEKGRNLRTVGDKWSAYQIKHFGSNSQPLYAIVDENLNRYNQPTGAIFNADEYLAWLKEGVENFKNK